MHSSTVILAATTLLGAATALQNGHHDSKMAARRAVGEATNFFEARAAIVSRDDKDDRKKRAKEGQDKCAGGKRDLFGRADLILNSMGDVDAAGVDRKISIGNVNGCSALFFFGGGWVVGGHLGAGGDEHSDAQKTAKLAKEKGATEKAILFASDDEAEGWAKDGIKEELKDIEVKAEDYGYDDDEMDNCFKFEVEAGTKTAIVYMNGDKKKDVTK